MVNKNLIHPELINVAEIIAEYIAERPENPQKILVDRDARRDHRVLLKWFDENWDFVEPVLKLSVLFTPEGEPIGEDY